MIARKRASYTRTPIDSRAHEENCQQLHDPAEVAPLRWCALSSTRSKRLVDKPPLHLTPSFHLRPLRSRPAPAGWQYLKSLPSLASCSARVAFVLRTFGVRGRTFRGRGIFAISLGTAFAVLLIRALGVRRSVLGAARFVAIFGAARLVGIRGRSSSVRRSKRTAGQ